MLTMTILHKILVSRRFLMEDETRTKSLDANKIAYLNAYLLSNFGIVVDQPQKLIPEMVEDISDVFLLNVPDSFYKNPQDTKYYTKRELLIEQLVSYFLVETGTGIYNRPEIFEKDLPEYKVGDEIKLREFKIISLEQATNVFSEIAKAYCDYTRPFNNDEIEEFKALYMQGFVNPEWDIRCKDNVFNLLEFDVSFASFLDKKDLVKLSIKLLGEHKKDLADAMDTKSAQLLSECLHYAKDCRLTKKQVKYYNKLLSLTAFNRSLDDKTLASAVHNSPQKRAAALLKEGKVLEAAKVYASNGSLLERNLRMLLSRANPADSIRIIDMIQVKNPMVLYQLINSLEEEAGKPRTFTFFKNRLVKHHVETEYETKWRKSRLSSGTIKFLHKVCLEKIYEYYHKLPSLGKIYINDSFYKLGVPTNTSAGGKGIDVVPTGSRLACRNDYIRTFVTWKDVYDIDAELYCIKKSGKLDIMNFRNYHDKPFGESILFSGDCRGTTGTEYFDIKLDEMKNKGYKYIVQSFHGYNGRLNQGEIYCGYQNKTDLYTQVWDPKNIEFQFKVFGDTRACMGFAIDLDTKEMIILNLMVEDESRVADADNINNITKYLDPNFLEVSIGSIFECRGELVNDPAEADVVCDDNYKPKSDAVKVIRSYELEKLVALVNEK